jgi:hypothetical protein
MPEAYGRDRKRRLNIQDRQKLYARALGLCQSCGGFPLVP